MIFFGRSRFAQEMSWKKEKRDHRTSQKRFHQKMQGV